MKLKSSIYVLLLLLFVMPTHAQNNNNKEKNKNKKEIVQINKNNKNKDSDTYKKEKDQNDDDGIYINDDNGNYKKDKKVKSNNGNGNAYGNNKNGLEGREFGQERARQARLQNQKRKQKFQETVVVYERRLPTFRERLQNASILLEQQKPKLTGTVYEDRRQRLVIAEQKMTLLEKTILIANTILN